jgi:hypothetical protein
MKMAVFVAPGRKIKLGAAASAEIANFRLMLARDEIQPCGGSG